MLVSPELAEVLTAIIFRVRAGKAALPLVHDLTERRATVHLGMPGVRRSAGRSSPGSP